MAHLCINEYIHNIILKILVQNTENTKQNKKMKF